MIDRITVIAFFISFNRSVAAGSGNRAAIIISADLLSIAAGTLSISAHQIAGRSIHTSFACGRTAVTILRIPVIALFSTFNGSITANTRTANRQGAANFLGGSITAGMTG